MRRISGRCPQQGGGRNNRNLETSSSSNESSDDDDRGSAVSGPASGIAQLEDRTAVGSPPGEGLHRQATAPIATPRRRSPPSRSLDLDDASDVRTFCSHLDLGLPLSLFHIGIHGDRATWLHFLVPDPDHRAGLTNLSPTLRRNRLRKCLQVRVPLGRSAGQGAWR